MWLSYPDIEPTLKKLGVNPKDPHPGDPSKPYYTLPVIQDDNGDEPVVVADSLTIIEYLEEKYPERPVFANTGKALQYSFEACVRVYVGMNMNPFVRGSTWLILDKRGQEYFRDTREKWDGMKLEEASPKGPIRDGHWKNLEQGFNKLAKVMNRNGTTSLFVAGGETPTFGDFILLSFLKWMKGILGDECEEYGFSKWDDGRWAKFLEKTEEWQKVH